jgi:hypothetical protein
MSLFTDTTGMGSPIQHHHVCVANDLQWIEGDLETLGSPHNYINQDDTDVFTIGEARISPWSFTSLPASRSPRIVVLRESAQLLLFTAVDTVDAYREPPHTETLILNTPLAILRGNLPFLSEARLTNFLDFFKGSFVPVTQVRIHYLAPSSAEMPSHARLLYVNRRAIQSYVSA